MEAHHVADGIVKDESKEIEFNDGMQATGKVVEERGEHWVIIGANGSGKTSRPQAKNNKSQIA